MKLPDVQTATLKKALLNFDLTMRNRPQWIGWEESPEHLYVICEEGKFYPVMQIVSMATDRSEETFGVDEARSYVLGRKLRAVKLLDELERVERLKPLIKPKTGNKPATKPSNWENAVIKSYFDPAALVNLIQKFLIICPDSFVDV